MYSKLSVFVFLLLAISSCGGGGGGGGSSEPSVPSATITLSVSDTQVYIGSTVTLTWSTANATSCTASGSWSGSKALSGSESITLNTAGANPFTLTCSNSAGVSSSRSVSTNVIGNSQGVVTGSSYISSSNVFLDINSNFNLDDNEPSSTSDSTGIFELPDDPQDIISLGGIDPNTSLNFENLSLSHKASSNSPRTVSALTTLDYLNTGALSINSMLSIDDSIDIYTVDPVANIGESSALNKYFEINSQLFLISFASQKYVNEVNSSSINSQTFFEILISNLQSVIDSGITYPTDDGLDLSEYIETSAFISDYVNDVAVANSLSSSESLDLFASSLQAVVKKISVRNDQTVTNAIINFSNGTFINDVISLANETYDSARIQSYLTNLNSIIASDQNIDESSLEQTLGLVDDTLDLNEDEDITFSPLSNDTISSGSDYYGLILTFTSPSNGVVRLNQDNSMTYTPDENYFGTDSFIYNVNVDGSSSTASVNIDIASVNDVPTFTDFVSTSSIDENTLVVLTVSVDDIENDPIGFSLSGSDADKLSISTSGQITFNTNPDFENPNDSNTDNQYDISVEASDGTDSISEELSITILDVENEGNPIIEGLSSQSFDENENISISFTVTDPQNDTITYSLSGVDSNLFSLSFDGLNASLTSSPKDYEDPEDSDGNNRYIFNVNFSDDLNTTSQEVEISVTNINDNSPIITSESSFTVPENQTSIATITASDADNDELSFSLSGTDADSIQITSSGVLSFKSNPDFESKNSYSINVIANDGINSTNQAVVINISNVNEAPEWILGTVAFEYQENTNNSETIDVPQDVLDPDGDQLTFSLTGTDASSFVISDNTISYNGTPDYENPTDSDQDNVYSINVIATDGELSATSPEFQVTVINLNDNNPVFVDLLIDVEVTNGQLNVFDITTSDADGDEVSVSVIGTDASLFTISDTNNLSFVTAPDYSNPSDSDGNNVYEINLQATDGERITQSDNISITVLEVNNPPVISGLESSYTLSENIAEIATFSVTDPENNELTIGVSGDDSSGFSIVSNLLFFEGGLNYELPTDGDANNVYEISVFADDGFNRTTQSVQITVTNVEEAPEFNIPEEISVEENTRLIANISVTDPESDSFSWEITGGDDAGILSLTNVSGGSGDLRFNNVQGADYEDPTDTDTDNVYLVQLTATEDKVGGLSRVLDLRISVTDIKDTWTISGTLLSNPYTLIDGDVPDIVSYPPVPNNDIESSQLILNPTDVIGRIGDNVETVVVLDDDGNCVEDPDNLGYCLTEEVSNVDPEDWYSFSGAPNLLLTLSVEGLIYEEDGSFYCCEYDSMDIDLLIYNEDGTLGDFTYTSTSTSTFKQIVIPSTGNYYAVVKSNTGTSKYVLTLGSNIFGVSALKNPQNHFAENRFISYIPFGKDFNTDDYIQPNFNTQLSDLDAKLVESNKILPKGLRVLNFNLNDEFNKIFKDDYLIESNNISQVNYLKHWKLLQHYRKLFPKLNLELDFKEQAHFSTDPLWPFQWGLAQIGLDSVLTTIGGDVKDVAVAVLDSGSPETTSSAWAQAAFIDGGFDFVPFNNAGDGDGYDSDPTDSEAAVDSHGTHVATTISALNNGLSINGFGIQTLPIRVLGRDGTGFRSDIVQGLLYAAGLPNASNTVYQGSTPVKVINMSLGSTGGSCGSTYQNAINDVYNRGITIVASSGNEAQEAPGFYGYPASCNNVISVAATDFLQNRAYYSTYNDQVDIAAPGGDLTADLTADGYGDGILAYDTNEDLSLLQGTSMASPHAAGAIAVLHALVPTLQPFQIEGLLADGHLTDDVGEEGKDDEFGYGALNLQKAVNRIISDEGLDFTYATIDTSTFNMGVEVNEFDFIVSKVGDGELSVSSLVSDISSAFNITASNVDSEGFGTYTVSLDRTQIPDGLYQSNLAVTFSNENTTNISISFQVGADRERISIPSIYLQLIDEFDESVVAGLLSMDDGGVSFYTEVSPGNYFWRFSSVIDRFIMDPAEFFNYYPDLSSSNEYFVLGENDIENSVVTLRVNKSTGALSTKTQVPDPIRSFKIQDFNQKRLKKIN